MPCNRVQNQSLHGQYMGGGGGGGEKEGGGGGASTQREGGRGRGRGGACVRDLHRGQAQLPKVKWC